LTAGGGESERDDWNGFGSFHTQRERERESTYLDPNRENSPHFHLSPSSRREKVGFMEGRGLK
jgi:hypothetical protein